MCPGFEACELSQLELMNDFGFKPGRNNSTASRRSQIGKEEGIIANSKTVPMHIGRECSVSFIYDAWWRVSRVTG